MDLVALLAPKGDKGMSTCPPPWSQSRVDVQSSGGRTKGVETRLCVVVGRFHEAWVKLRVKRVCLTRATCKRACI